MSSSVADRRSPLVLLPGQPAPRFYDCVVEALPSAFAAAVRTATSFAPDAFAHEFDQVKKTRL